MPSDALSDVTSRSALLSSRFYGNSEDGDAFFNSIRTLFLSFNTLMDRPLDEGVKIKVKSREGQETIYLLFVVYLCYRIMGFFFPIF